MSVRYIGATELCHLYRIKSDYVYVLASRHKWRRFRLNRQVMYYTEDVIPTLRAIGLLHDSD